MTTDTKNDVQPALGVAVPELVRLGRPNLSANSRDPVKRENFVQATHLSLAVHLAASRRILWHFWSYTSVWGGRRFLKEWTTMALRSRIEPIKKFARTLRTHEPQLLNWFRARGVFAAGATEGFNNKARITTRKAYGFRNHEHVRIALYHSLGNLQEPHWLTHKFF